MSIHGVSFFNFFILFNFSLLSLSLKNLNFSSMDELFFPLTPTPGLLLSIGELVTDEVAFCRTEEHLLFGVEGVEQIGGGPAILEFLKNNEENLYKRLDLTTCH